MDNRAQTTFEYLVILGVVLALVSMVVYVSKISVSSEEFTDIVNASFVR